jgi:hypothetical protein
MPLWHPLSHQCNLELCRTAEGTVGELLNAYYFLGLAFFTWASWVYGDRFGVVGFSLVLVRSHVCLLLGAWLNGRPTICAIQQHVALVSLLDKWYSINHATTLQHLETQKWREREA